MPLLGTVLVTADEFIAVTETFVEDGNAIALVSLALSADVDLDAVIVTNPLRSVNRMSLI